MYIGLTAQTLSLSVTDDGRGMAHTSIPSGGGHGLPNIERRVRKLNGQHRYHAAEPTGTVLALTVPLRQDAE